MTSKLVVGSIGLASSEAIHAIPSDGNPTSEIIKIAVQLIVGLATLIGLFKKKKEPKT
jgi:hypothetical protein